MLQVWGILGRFHKLRGCLFATLRSIGWDLVNLLVVYVLRSQKIRPVVQGPRLPSLQCIFQHVSKKMESRCPAVYPPRLQPGVWLPIDALFLPAL